MLNNYSLNTCISSDKYNQLRKRSLIVTSEKGGMGSIQKLLQVADD